MPKNKSSRSVLLYVHRDCTGYCGRGALDGYFDFHAAPELCHKYSSMLPYVHRDCTGYCGRGALDGYFDFHTAPELCHKYSSMLPYVHRDCTGYWDSTGVWTFTRFCLIAMNYLPFSRRPQCGNVLTVRPADPSQSLHNGLCHLYVFNCELAITGSSIM